MRSYCQQQAAYNRVVDIVLSPDEFFDDQLTPDDAEHFVPLLKHDEISVPDVAKQWKDNSFVDVCNVQNDVPSEKTVKCLVADIF